MSNQSKNKVVPITETNENNTYFHGPDGKLIHGLEFVMMGKYEVDANTLMLIPHLYNPSLQKPGVMTQNAVMEFITTLRDGIKDFIFQDEQLHKVLLHITTFSPLSMIEVTSWAVVQAKDKEKIIYQDLSINNSPYSHIGRFAQKVCDELTVKTQLETMKEKYQELRTLVENKLNCRFDLPERFTGTLLDIEDWNRHFPEAVNHVKKMPLFIGRRG